MDVPNKDKEVYFFKYCPICINELTPEKEEPCCECLTQFFNTNSHKPIFFKEKSK